MPAGTDILLMDQDLPDRLALRQHLARHGFRVAVADGDRGLRAAIARQAPTLLLLGVDPSQADGLAPLAAARESHRGGVILLMTSAGASQRVTGLDMGADDCVARPFDSRELLARVKSVYRRYSGGGRRVYPANALTIGSMRLQVDARRLTAADGTEIVLTRLEFELLRALASRPRQVMSRDQLSRLARQRDRHPEDRSIDVRIAALRRKMEADPAKPAHIKTIRGRGYMLIPGGR